MHWRILKLGLFNLRHILCVLNGNRCFISEFSGNVTHLKTKSHVTLALFIEEMKAE